jgi:DNA repair photolyase
MALSFSEYEVRRVVNLHKHVDGPWFWDKYSALPYVGCRSGCEFCYCRGHRYLGGRDPETFDTRIRVKTNAPEQLRLELSRLERDVVAAGDWQQPAEDRYRLSRRMLEVILELGFPLFVVERSPLITRDLDLLTEINREAWVGVLFSISSLDPRVKRAFEPRSPGVERRLGAMAELAEKGILTGTALMPVFPHLHDDEESLEQIVMATKDHGGRCVLAGGLSMSGVQAERTLNALRRLAPELEPAWRALYNWDPGGRPNQTPPRGYAARLGNTVRSLCARHGLRDRMPRYIQPGPLAINKRIAERLFLRTYDLELENAESYRIWAYRKAAWTVDECGESLGEMYRSQGEGGLRGLPAIGTSLAAQIARWLSEERGDGPPQG